MKRCSCCEAYRPISQFQKLRRGIIVETAKCLSCREIAHQLYLANKEKLIARAGLWQKKNWGHRVAYMQNYMQTLRREILQKLGGKCVKCGFTDPRALQIDHVDGGGTIEVRMSSSSYSYLKGVLADQYGRYQLLCANCNWIKRSEMGEQPYSQKRKMAETGT